MVDYIIGACIGTSVISLITMAFTIKEINKSLRVIAVTMIQMKNDGMVRINHYPGDRP